MRIATGDTSRYCYFAAVDVTDLKTPETGLTGFTVAHSIGGGADVPWTTPTTTEVDATVAPGLYALLLDEMPTITAGVDEQEVAIIISHASMRTVFRTVELYRAKVTAGETLTVASGQVKLSGTVNDFDEFITTFETTHGTGSYEGEAGPTAQDIWEYATRTVDLSDVTDVLGTPADTDLATDIANLPTAAENATTLLATALPTAARTDGATATLGQALAELMAGLGLTKIVRSGTTLTAYAFDETTIYKTWTIDSATAPTTRTSAS